MRSSLLAIVMLFCLAGIAHGQKSQPKTERRDVAVEVFQVLGLPVNVHEAVLLPKDGGYVLRCRMSNESSSEISGLRYVLTSIDASGGTQLIANRTEGFGLPAYGMKSLTFVTPIRFNPKEGSRFVLMVEQVLSAEAIWEVIKARYTRSVR